jgi:hypothetical protein
MVVVDRDSDDDRFGINQPRDWDGQLQRSAPQLRPTFHLDRKPAAIVDAMHEPIDTSVEQWKENVKATVRAHDKLHPDFPLGKLTNHSILVPMPGQ